MRRGGSSRGAALHNICALFKDNLLALHVFATNAQDFAVYKTLDKFHIDKTTPTDVLISSSSFHP
jgi:hypothetical protein